MNDPSYSDPICNNPIYNNPLYMVRMDLDVEALIQFIQQQGLNHGRDEDLGYATHAWLTACFGPLAPKPYRIFPSQSSSIRMLGYSENPGQILTQRAETSGAETALAVLRQTALDCTCLPEFWKLGQRYRFEVLICPVSRRLQSEKDVFLRYKEYVPANERLPSRSDVYREWLRAQMLGAAGIQGFRLHSFKLVRLVRRTQCRRGQPRLAPPMTRPQALCRGILSVEDPARFDRLLRRGVGRHRAFGYGMVLLAPET